MAMETMRISKILQNHHKNPEILYNSVDYTAVFISEFLDAEKAFNTFPV